MIRLVYGLRLYVWLSVVFTAAFMLIFSVPCAMADFDSGEIAVIEDTNGELSDMMTQGMPNVWLHYVTCKFYLSHHDQYDAVFVFSSGLLNGITNTQQGWAVYSPSKGIGRGLPSQGNYFCSYSQRLRQAVKMGEINILPNNPDDNAPIVPMYPLTGIQLVGHEFGHQWLAAAKYDKGDGNGQQCLLRGYEPTSSDGGGSVGGDQCSGLNESDFNQHWSYFSNSRSLMYGSMLEDNGNGTFTATYENPKFSELDQYLMGLRLPEEVGEYFFVDKGDPSGSASIPMMPGSSGTMQGTRVNVYIEDIIRAMGAREPALENCHWKAAWIIVHPLGLPPTEQQIAKVDTCRQRWTDYYAWATDNRGSFDSSLDGCGTGTESCPGEVSEFCGAVACSDGQRRCKTANLVEECNSEEWSIIEECVFPDVCINGACAESPVDGDEEIDGDAEESADGDNITEDGDESADGDLNKPDGDMPVDEDGDAEEPVVGGECTYGQTRCVGDVWYECSASGKGWLETDCSVVGQSCVAESGCGEGGSGADDGSSGGCAAAESSGLFCMMLLSVLLYFRREQTERQ